MITIRTDATGKYKIHWPKGDRAVLRLGQAYTTYEAGLDPAEQLALPTLAAVQAAFTTAQAASGTAINAEADRAESAETYKQQLEQAKKLLRQARFTLMGMYTENWATLRRWGFETAVKSGKVNVRLPRAQKDWIRLLNAYVAHETTLPAEERVSRPAFEAVSALATSLNTAYQNRESGKTSRERGISSRSTVTAQLLDLLKTAALVLVVTRYNRQVTNDLQLWGFDVVASRGSTPAAPPVVDVPPAEGG